MKRTKLVIVVGAFLAAAGIYFVARPEPEPAARPRRPAHRMEREDAPCASIERHRHSTERGADMSRTAAEQPGHKASFRSIDPDERDRRALTLMSEPAGDLVAGLRREFLQETDVRGRLRLLHILIVQHKRFGAAFGIDREAMEFLNEILADADHSELHGSAFAALGRMETADAFALVGETMRRSGNPADFARGAEELSGATHPAAAEVARSLFRSDLEAEKRLVVANVIFMMSKATPALGLEGTLRGEVLPVLREMAAAAPEGWFKNAVARIIENIH